MKKTESMRDINPFGLRLPAELKHSIEVAAGNNRRSMNAEIIARLTESFIDTQYRREMSAKVEQMEAEVLQLSQQIAELELLGDKIRKEIQEYLESHPEDARDDAMDALRDRYLVNSREISQRWMRQHQLMMTISVITSSAG